MPRWGMGIDLDLCTACGACVAACKVENNVAVVSPEESDRGRRMHWLRLRTEVRGEFPDAEIRTVPHLCMMCERPPCARVCPVRATYLGDDHLVGQIYPRCIGCRYCMAACPYGAKVFNWSAPDWTPEYRAALNPDVSVRPKGVVEKCTFCHQRLQVGRERARAAGRELREADYRPACVGVCPTGALVFGDLDDPASAVSALRRSPRATRVAEHLGTEPKVFYLERRDARI